MRTAAQTAPGVVLREHDAEQLAELLGLLEDWLLHAGDDTRAELADFAFHGPAGSRDPGYVRWLIDRLGTHSVALTRQLHTCTTGLATAPHLPAGRS